MKFIRDLAMQDRQQLIKPYYSLLSICVFSETRQRVSCFDQLPIKSAHYFLMHTFFLAYRIQLFSSRYLLNTCLYLVKLAELVNGTNPNVSPINNILKTIFSI